MRKLLLFLGVTTIACVLWAGLVFEHTSKSDWESGARSQVNTGTFPGDVILADDTSNPEFYEIFNGTSYNGDSWDNTYSDVGRSSIIVSSNVCINRMNSWSNDFWDQNCLITNSSFSFATQKVFKVKMEMDCSTNAYPIIGGFYLAADKIGPTAWFQNSTNWIGVICEVDSSGEEWVVEKKSGAIAVEMFSTSDLDSVSKEIKICLDGERARVYLDDSLKWEGNHSFAFSAVYIYLVFSTRHVVLHEARFRDVMVYDYKYQTTGTVENTLNVLNGAGAYGTLRWAETTPSGTKVKFKTRTSANGVSGWSDWSSYYRNSTGENIQSPPNNYLQYRAVLSTSDTDVTPRLHSATFDFEPKGSLARDNVYNYPNPFSPLQGPTTLTFSVSQSNEARLAILTAAGRKVWEKHIPAVKVLAGKNVLEWDGRDSKGELVPNGVYLYVVEAEGKKVINKIAVVR